MINKGELRIGNFVLDQFGDIRKIVEIRANRARMHYNIVDYYNDIQPVPLTEDILKATNLVKESYIYCAPEHIKEISGQDLGIKYCSFWFNKRLNKWMDTQSRVTVDYLHQLQNLYFCLTREELIYNGEIKVV